MTEDRGSRVGRSELHDVLADQGCRAVLDALRGTERVSFDALVDSPVATDGGGAGTVDAATENRRSAIRLHHSLLPRLAAVDAVVYDADAGTVWKGSAAPLAYDLLDAVAAASDRSGAVQSVPGGGEDA